MSCNWLVESVTYKCKYKFTAELFEIINQCNAEYFIHSLDCSITVRIVALFRNFLIRNVPRDWHFTQMFLRIDISKGFTIRDTEITCQLNSVQLCSSFI